MLHGRRTPRMEVEMISDEKRRDEVDDKNVRRRKAVGE